MCGRSAEFCRPPHALSARSRGVSSSASAGQFPATVKTHNARIPAGTNLPGQELVLEHTGVGDAGILSLAKGCQQLTRLHLTTYSTTTSRVPQLAAAVAEGGPGLRGVSDVALKHIADHCGALRDLVIMGALLWGGMGCLVAGSTGLVIRMSPYEWFCP